MTPYASWFRLLFFENYFSPSFIILTIDNYRFIEIWLERYKKPLDFSNSKKFWEPIPANKIKRFVDKFREYSSLINLLIHGIRNMKTGNEKDWIDVNPEENKDDKIAISKYLKESMRMYKNLYSDRFMIVSFSNNKIYNELISKFCKTNDILFCNNSSILVGNNRLNNAGHLNLRGNKALGEFLYKSFMKKLHFKNQFPHHKRKYNE